MHLLYSVSARYIEAATDAGEAAECPQVCALFYQLLIASTGESKIKALCDEVWSTKVTAHVPSQVSVLIRYMLSMRGRRLWAYEDADPSVCPSPGDVSVTVPSAAALAAMVGAVHDALAFETGLQVRFLIILCSVYVCMFVCVVEFKHAPLTDNTFTQFNILLSVCCTISHAQASWAGASLD